MSERTPKSSSLREGEVCQSNGCNNKAVTTCKYCKRVFCKEHAKALIVSSPREIWNLNKIRNSDPEKYKKYMEDWNKTDGHPCPEYTEKWNKEHEKHINKILNPPRPHPPQPPPLPPPKPPPLPPTKPPNRLRLAIVILLVVLVLVFAFSIFEYLSIYSHLTNPSSNISNMSINSGTQQNSSNAVNKSSSNNIQIYTPLNVLLANTSKYINTTVTTTGLLIQTTLVNQVPGAYSLFDSQGGGVQVILPQNTIFRNRENITVTGKFQVYQFGPQPWNGYTSAQVYYINGTYMPRTAVTEPINMSTNASFGNLVFCINRMVFRTSNSRGLNNSQINELVNYCEYYNYEPGIVNKINETVICQGVYQCQTGN